MPDISVMPESASVQASAESTVSKQPAKKRDYFHFLDGFRGYGTIGILAFHGLGPITQRIFIYSGLAGLEVFFVMSGFLITKLILEERQKTGKFNIKNFYVRRILRLSPAYYFFLIFFAVFKVATTHDLKRIDAALIAACYMTDVDLCLGNLHRGLSHTWSLGVEEKFYLLWSLLIKTVPALGLPVTALTYVLVQLRRAMLVCEHATWTRILAGFDSHSDLIMLGCLLAFLYNNKKAMRLVDPIISHRLAPTIAGGAFLYLYCTFKYNIFSVMTVKQSLGFWNFHLPMFGLATVTLIVVLLRQPNSYVRKILEVPLFVWLGRLSYSIYIWHLTAFGFFNSWFINPATATNPWVGAAAEFAKFWFAVSFGVISFYIIERPFLKLKDRFI